MVVCHVEASWTNGVHQLPDAVYYLRNSFLWNWIRTIWQTAKDRNLLCSCRGMDVPDYFFQHLAPLLFIWTFRVGLAESYLLEETTLCKKLSALNISINLALCYLCTSLC